MLIPVRRPISGVTLIEVIVTLSVLTLVLALSAPALSRWVNRFALGSSAERLRSALQSARAEAVARNARIRVTLGDASGLPQWQLACVRVNADCPAQLFRQPASGRDPVRWAATDAASAGDLSVIPKAGNLLPGSVDFFPLGDAPQVASGTDIARIDVLIPDDATAGRRVVRIDGGGNVRLCDPELKPPQPGACH